MSLKALFVYTDERGRPVLRKVRGSNDTDKRKDFKTQAALIRNNRLRWMGAPRAVHRYQPDWADRVIYNLPVVLDALRLSEPVWFTEGEREADLLMTVARVAATTTPGGINRMTPEQADWFVRYRSTSPVNILMDSDDAGAFGGWARYMALRDAGVGASRLRLWQPVEGYKDATEAVMEVGLRTALVRASRRRIRDAAIRYGTERASRYTRAGSVGSAS
ncbi:hypothetical protein [Nocardioides sp.]|uniref:hypothetical protein n=1 Tax=Nocardioides sp. TaxID=35761 RepID=UPI003785043B